MSTEIIVAQLKSGVKITPTGNTRHYHGSAEIGEISTLRIVEDDGGYFLFHYDHDGRNVIDTFHDSLDEALSQAEFDYGLTPDDWDILSNA